MKKNSINTQNDVEIGKKAMQVSNILLSCVVLVVRVGGFLLNH